METIRKKNFNIFIWCPIIILFGVLFIYSFQSRSLFQIDDQMKKMQKTLQVFEALSSKVLFRQYIGGERPGNPLYEYYIMDANGGQIELLQFGGVGSASWSYDGKYIAVGCASEKVEICIYQVDLLPNVKYYPMERINYSFEDPPYITGRIDLSNYCGNGLDERVRVLYPDWSPNSRQMAIICNDKETVGKNLICVVSISGTVSDCWRNNEVNPARVAWSPTENILAISGKANEDSKIYLVGLDGKELEYITDGWAPEWSRDGQKIFFIRRGEKIDKPATGLAVVKKDGSEFNWVFPPVYPPAEDEKIIGFSDCNGGEGCRISLSPNGRYLMFAGGYLNPNTTQLFRLDMETGEIIRPYHLSLFASEPDWGP